MKESIPLNQKLFLKMELATLQSSIFYAFVYATFSVVRAQKREFYTAFISVVFDVIKVFFSILHACETNLSTLTKEN